jgi:pimeloyl-ACP methyl ester carboxylesterase
VADASGARRRQPGLASLDGVFSGHFRFVRYDERGCGMSDWNVRDLSLERRVQDLETVVQAARLAEGYARHRLAIGLATILP